MSTLNVYSYYDATGVRKYADFNDVIFTGTWASTGTYLASAMQVANYGNSQYFAIVDSINRNPTTQPTRWQPIRFWSPFILVSQGGGGTNTDETLQIAISGSNTAVLAYGYALAAQSSANAALNVAVQAYGVATTGTQTANTALSTANTALGIANEALSIAVTGTNALVAEAGTRSSADQFLQNQIYVEAGTRNQADQALLNMFYVEQGTRSSADQSLLNRIYTEQGTRSSADQFLQNQIYVEAGTRSSADQALLNKINSMASTVVGLTGTNYWWMSNVSGGPDNVQITVVNGVVTGVTEMPICYEDFERYGTGAAGTNSLSLGSFWNGAAYINLETLGAPMAEERYASYAAGSVYTLLSTAGTGWAANGTTAMSPVIGYAGSDHFQSYLVGTIFSGNTGTLPDNGDYWSGTTTIYTRAS